MKNHIIRYIFMFLAMISLSSCNEEESTEKRDSSFTISLAGVQNFGTVIVGSSKISAFKIVNNSSSTQSITLTGFGSPFVFHRISGDCSIVEIEANSSCTLYFKFTPTDTTSVSQNVGINSTTFTFTGKGKSAGVISLNTSAWNAGSFTAGSVQTKTFTLTNSGDESFSDILTDTSGFGVQSHTCGELVEPGENCQVILTVQKASAEYYVEQIELYTPESSNTTLINFSGTVTPGAPSGTIGLSCVSTSLIANNTDTTICTTNPIEDDFGNVVSDGHTVSLSVEDLYVVGDATSLTESGQVSFEVRATDSVGTGVATFTSGDASGYIELDLVSGPAYGTITFQSHADEIYADNASYVSVTTDILVNAQGVTLSNGETLNVTLTGPGTLESSTVTVYNGRATIKVSATIISGSSTIDVFANPIYDTDNNITGYLANGSFSVDFVPVPDEGNFEITSDQAEIYNETSGTYADTANITVGPILNVYDTPLGAGVDVEITLTNGYISGSTDTQITLTTDASSEVNFDLISSGSRGYITIYACVDATCVSYSHKVVGEEDVTYLQSGKYLSLYYSFENSQNSLLSPTSSNWKPQKLSISALEENDSSSFGLKRSYGGFYELDFATRHYIWECMIPVKHYVISTPCADKTTSDATFLYNYYYPYMIETEDENSPISIGGNIDSLPVHTSAFGGDVVSPSIFYDKTYNATYMFGGALVVESEDPTPVYTLEEHESIVTYSQLTLFAHMPLSSDSFTDELKYSMFVSYSTKEDKTFIFGGLSYDTDNLILEAGDELYLFENGDLTLISVASGSFGSPSPRYQNAVYFDEEENKVYILGGLNILDSLLDDLWVVDLNASTPTWDRINASVGLDSSLFTTRVGDILTYIQTGSTDLYDLISLDEIRQLRLIKKESHDDFLVFKYRQDYLKDIDLTTGVITDNIEDEYAALKESDDVLYHKNADRIYRQKVYEDGIYDTYYSFMDAKLGEQVNHLLVFDLGVDAKSHALYLNPEILAKSKNETTNVSTTTEYGVDVYIYNYEGSTWELLGQNLSSDSESLTNNAYKIGGSLANPTDYLDLDGKLYLLIKPSQDVGYQINNSQAYPGTSFLEINYAHIEGVF